MIQGGIPVKAHHQRRVFQQCAGQSQFDRGVPAVNYQDLRAFRHPAMRQSNHGHQNIDGRFVLPRRLATRHKPFYGDRLGARFPHLALASAATNAITTYLQRLTFELSRAQDGKKWQGPRASSPRQFDNHSQRHPLQAEAFDDVLLTRSDRVSVTAQLSDPFSAPAFDRIVGSQNDDLLHHQGKDQNDQSEQDSRNVQRAPLRPIKHPMVVLKMFLIAQTDDPQASCHSAFAALKQRSEQERFGVLPSRLGKQGLKNYNQAQQFGRQCSHMEDFSGKRVFPKLTRSADTFSKTADFVHFVMPARSAGITKWTKSSYQSAGSGN